MNKKKMISLTLVIAILLSTLLFGCGSNEKQAANTDQSSNKTTEIRFMGEASAVTDALESLIPDFEKKTGIKVTVEKYPYETVVQKAMLDFTSGTKTYDVLSLPYEYLGRVAEKGYIQDIEKYLADPKLTPEDFDTKDIVPALWKASSSWNDKIYGFPSNPCIMFMVYRKDLLENPEEKAAFKSKYGYDLNVPKTTKEYYNATEFFTRNKGEKLAGETLTDNFYGLATMSKRHTALTCDFLNWMWDFGGGIFDSAKDSGNLTMNSDNNLKALDYYKSLQKNAVPGSIEYTWDELVTAMQQGIIFSGIFFNDGISGLLDSSKSKVAGKLGYALTPSDGTPAAHLGAWTYMIPKDSNNSEAAYKFMNWAMTKEIQKKWTALGGIPSRESVYKDPEINKIEFMPMTLEAMKISDNRPRIAEWGEMDTVMQEEIHKALSDQIKSKEALDNIQKEYKRILNK